jgi:tRNA modification GTPase
MHSNDTICAVSTPPGVGGIAIIRVSGPMTFEYCDRYFSKNIEAQDANTIIFGEWREGKRVIDEVLISKFIGPASFTGEDVVEISVHGSRYIQAETLRTLIESG